MTARRTVFTSVAIALVMLTTNGRPADATAFFASDPFNYVDINQSNPIGFASGVLIDDFGVHVSSSSADPLGAPPPGTTVAATQGPFLNINVPYANSPALPSLFETSREAETAIGDLWTLTVTNGSNTEQGNTPQIVNNTTPLFVTGVNVAATGTSGALTSMTLSWTIPPASTANNEELYVYDYTKGDTIALTGTIGTGPSATALPATTTSYTLSSTQLAYFNNINNKNDQYSIDVEARISNPSHPTSTDPSNFEAAASSFTSLFTPSTIATAAGATVYLPAGSSNPYGPNDFSVPIAISGETVYVELPVPGGVTGFIFATAAGNPNFASVDLPANPTDYELLIWNGSSFVLTDADLAPGTLYDFADGGVSEFEVLGIDPPPDFLTGLTFSGAGTFTGTIDPVSVPEPTSLSLIVSGIIGLGVIRYRRKNSGRNSGDH